MVISKKTDSEKTPRAPNGRHKQRPNETNVYRVIIETVTELKMILIEHPMPSDRG